MATPNAITATQLFRLGGLPDTPVIVDGRIADGRTLDTRMLPDAARRHFKATHPATANAS